KDGAAVGNPVTGITGTTYDFTPAISVSGSYTFKVTAVGDGTVYANSDESSDSAAYVYTAPATKLGMPSGLAWDGAITGKATWGAVSNASSYTVQLYKDGMAVGNPVTGITGTTYDFTPAISVSGSYTFKVTAVGDGTVYANSDESADSAAYAYTAPATKLGTPAGLAWDGAITGKAAWGTVSNASSYTVQLYKDGAAVGNPVTGITGTTYDFTPAISVSGSYTFKVTAIGDGTAYANSDESADSAAYVYTAPATKLGTPAGLAWDGAITGKATWGAVSNASSYTIQLYKDGMAVGNPVTGITGTTYDFTPAISVSGSYTFKVTAVGDGTVYANSDESADSAAYAYTAPATKLGTPAGLAWDGAITGKAAWGAVSNASSYTVQLYKDGMAVGNPVTGITGTTYEFTPAISVSGSYTFKVTAVGDGTVYANSDESSDSAAYAYTAPATKLGTPAGLAWDGAIPGKAAWGAVSNASSYTVQLYKDGMAVGNPVTGINGTTYDFTPAISVSGSYTFKVTAVGDGTAYANSDESADSSAYAYTAPATKLGTPAGLAWDGTIPGKATWGTVSNASSYTIQLYKDGMAVGNPVTGITGTTYDFTPAISVSGSYTFKVTAVGDGTAYANSDAATVAAGLNAYTGSFRNNYDALDASTYITQVVLNGGKLSVPVQPVRDGYIFDGWYREAACVNPWEFNSDTVSGDIILYAKWVKSTHTASGKVIDDQEPVAGNVSGATVKVFKGSIQLGTTATTDSNGNFTITGVQDGIYNLVVTKNGHEVTVYINVAGNDFSTGTIVLPNGNKNSKLDVVGSGTPDVVVDHLNDIFKNSNIYTSADQTVVNQGGTVEIKLTVQKNDNSQNKDKVNAAMSSGGYNYGTILDLDLSKTVTSTGGVQSQTAITATDSLIKLVIPLPAGLQGKNRYVIYRAHDYGNGVVVDQITTAANSNGEYIEVSSDKTQLTLYAKYFSTYAIAFSDSNPTNTSSGSSGSGSQSYTITVLAGEGGSISPDSSIVGMGNSKIFTIKANDGYTISDVQVDGKSVGAVSSYTFSGVTAAHTIKAVFAKIEGLPYYLDGTKKVFIGFASDAGGTMKYIAPEGKTVLFQRNPKNLEDISGHWAKPFIDFVTEREIFTGTGANTFSPDTGMTRAMFATVIGHLYENSYGKISTEASNTFADTDPKAYYANYVEWAAAKGIIAGVGGGKFAPDRRITREEMASILYKFAKFLDISGTGTAGTKLSYPDASQIASWAADAAKYCQQTGIISGRDGGRFVPKGIATRAEVAAIMQKFVDIVVKSK
ncbi:MAG TPA: S-layer homology domain-containing protein, partial [Ruminiclostridium sp.]|nr:S-layer homology domain-containing protein [Ruminiclostridium sp.]